MLREFGIISRSHLSRLVLEIIFSLFTGHMSFQIFLLVGHLPNWTGYSLLTDNTLKKRTQDVMVRCSVIVSGRNVKLAGHFQNLVRQCLMTDCYFQHCKIIKISLLNTCLTDISLEVKDFTKINTHISAFTSTCTCMNPDIF